MKYLVVYLYAHLLLNIDRRFFFFAEESKRSQKCKSKEKDFDFANQIR